MTGGHRRRNALLLLACAVVGPSCDSDSKLPAEVSDAARTYCPGDSDAVEAEIQNLLQELSLEEKVGLMHGASLGAIDGTWQVAGIEGRNIPGFRMLDGPRGVSELSGAEATVFPVAMARAASWDPSLEERVGEAMGRELRAVGADVLLAPTINILRHPRWGRAQETYGEDPHHMAEFGVAFIRGAQRHVIATAKHFAVNSIDDTRFQVDVTVEDQTLREIYLPHFRRAVQDAQVGAVMSAYNSVNGAFCGENAVLLNDILKEEWDFQGLVMSDWLLGTKSTVPSANAGLDLEMPFGTFYGSELVAAVRRGDVTMATIDGAVRRLLRAQLCFGLRERSAPDPSALVTDEHVALALEAAQRGIVLLKNDGALPLDMTAGARVVVAGPLSDVENIGDLGSSLVTPPYVVTALQGFEARAEGVTVEHVDTSTLDPEKEEALRTASAVVLVTGLTAEDEGEGTIAAGDRQSLALPTGQVDEIRSVAALNPRTIVVLEGGAALLVEDFVDEVGALLMAWYPGIEGGHAIADVVFGRVNPSGRLPMSFPRAEADLPPFDNVSTAVTYGYFHGYRHLQRDGTMPRFPFGFGLSYTTFELSNLRVEEVGSDYQVSVDVTNRGSARGTETVQVYVSSPPGGPVRGARDLRAFGQVTLDPGESGTAMMALPAQRLEVWTEAGWTLRPGDYTVAAGSHVESLPLESTLTIAAQ
ncbi:MAG: glycoside hydrolase family 3 C-terminal domain-containing protein [Myxococcota bacterium]